jgi:threonine dehydratase
VIAGQGTIAMEILRQHEGPIDAVFVAIGGGGLISGVAAYIKAVRPEIKVIGVQTVDSDAMARSVEAGRRVTLATWACSPTAPPSSWWARRPSAWPASWWTTMCASHRRLCAAIKDIFQDTRSIVEPAGALGVAGLKQYVATHKCKGQTFVAIACGANMNFDRLRFVAERPSRRAARSPVRRHHPRGARQLPPLLRAGGPRSVTEFNYRISDTRQAHVFVGVSISKPDEADKIARSFQRHGFATVDLTDDELAKEHVRHMVGGRSDLAEDERSTASSSPSARAR